MQDLFINRLPIFIIIAHLFCTNNLNMSFNSNERTSTLRQKIAELNKIDANAIMTKEELEERQKKVNRKSLLNSFRSENEKTLNITVAPQQKELLKPTNIAKRIFPLDTPYYRDLHCKYEKDTTARAVPTKTETQPTPVKSFRSAFEKKQQFYQQPEQVTSNHNESSNLINLVPVQNQISQPIEKIRPNKTEEVAQVQAQKQEDIKLKKVEISSQQPIQTASKNQSLAFEAKTKQVSFNIFAQKISPGTNDTANTTSGTTSILFGKAPATNLFSFNQNKIETNEQKPEPPKFNLFTSSSVTSTFNQPFNFPTTKKEVVTQKEVSLIEKPQQKKEYSQPCETFASRREVGITSIFDRTNTNSLNLNPAKAPESTTIVTTSIFKKKQENTEKPLEVKPSAPLPLFGGLFGNQQSALTPPSIVPTNIFNNPKPFETESKVVNKPEAVVIPSPPISNESKSNLFGGAGLFNQPANAITLNPSTLFMNIKPNEQKPVQPSLFKQSSPIIPTFQAKPIPFSQPKSSIQAVKIPPSKPIPTPPVTIQNEPLFTTSKDAQKQQVPLFAPHKPLFASSKITTPIQQAKQEVKPTQLPTKSILKPDFQKKDTIEKAVTLSAQIGTGGKKTEPASTNNPFPSTKGNIFSTPSQSNNLFKPSATNMFQSSNDKSTFLNNSNSNASDLFKSGSGNLFTQNTSGSSSLFAPSSGGLFSNSGNQANQLFASSAPPTTSLFSNMQNSIFNSNNTAQVNDEEDEEGEDDNEPEVAEDNADPSLSTGKYDYTSTKVSFKESGKYKEGSMESAIEASVSIEQIDSTEDRYLILRMPNKCVGFCGKILKGLTEIRFMKTGQKNVEIKKILQIGVGTAKAELKLVRIQFKEQAIGERFLKEVDSIVKKQ